VREHHMERFEQIPRRPIEPACGYTYKNFVDEPKEKEEDKKEKKDEPTKKKQRYKHIIGASGKLN